MSSSPDFRADEVPHTGRFANSYVAPAATNLDEQPGGLDNDTGDVVIDPHMNGGGQRVNLRALYGLPPTTKSGAQMNFPMPNQPMQQSSNGTGNGADIAQLAQQVQEMKNLFLMQATQAQIGMQQPQYEPLVQRMQAPPARANMDLSKVLSSLRLPFLSADGEPKAPDVLVMFYLGNNGTVGFHYHSAFVSGKLLVLTIDTRFKGLAQFVPPDYGPKEFVRIEIPSQKRAWLARLMGLKIAYGAFDLCLPVISEEVPYAEEEAEPSLFKGSGPIEFTDEPA